MPIHLTRSSVLDALQASSFHQWTEGRSSSALILSGTFGSGKSTAMEQVEQHCKANVEGVRCIKFICSDITSITPLYAGRLIYKAILSALDRALCMSPSQDIHLPSKESVLLNESVSSPEIRGTYQAYYQFYLGKRDALKTMLIRIYAALGHDASHPPFYCFNQILDVDFEPDRFQSDPTIQETNDLLVNWINIVCQKHAIKLALFVDDFHFMDYSSWEYIRGIVDKCPSLFLCTTICLKKKVDHNSYSLIAATELTLQYHAMEVVLEDLTRQDVIDLFKLNDHMSFLSVIESIQVADEILKISKGNMHHSFMIIQELVRPHSAQQISYQLCLDRLRQSELMDETRLLTQMMSLYTPTMRRLIFFSAILGNYVSLTCLESLLRAKFPGSDKLFINTSTLNGMEVEFQEPIFIHDLLHDSLPGRLFRFKNWKTLKAIQSMSDIESFRHTAYRYFKECIEVEKLMNVQWRSLYFPFFLRLAALQPSIPKEVRVEAFERAFFYYFKRGCLPNALYYNNLLFDLIKRHPFLEQSLTCTKEEWFQASFQIQSKLRIGNYLQRKDFCLQQYRELGTDRGSYPSFKWHYQFYNGYLSAWMMMYNLSFKAQNLKGSAAEMRMKKYQLEITLMQMSFITNLKQDQYLSVLQSYRLAYSVRKTQKLVFAQASNTLALHLCVINGSWGRCMKALNDGKQIEPLLSFINPELLELIVIGYLGTAAELGMFSKVSQLAEKFDVLHRTYPIPDQASLASFHIYNAAYLAIGSHEGRKRNAEKQENICHLRMQVSLTQSCARAAIAAVMAELGIIVESKKLAIESRKMFHAVEGMDKSGTNIVYRFFILHDCVFVHACSCAAQLSVQFNFTTLFDLMQLLSDEWRCIGTHTYWRFINIIPHLKMLTFLFFTLRLYSVRHGVDHLPARFTMFMIDIAKNMQRFLKDRSKRHPLWKITKYAIMGCLSLFEGYFAQAIEHFIQAFKEKGMGGDEYAYFRLILCSRIRLTQVLVGITLNDPNNESERPHTSVGTLVLSRWNWQRKSSSSASTNTNFHASQEPIESPNILSVDQIKEELREKSMISELLLVDLMTTADLDKSREFLDDDAFGHRKR